MTVIAGSSVNQYSEMIVPEHAILTKIKNHAKTKRFDQVSVYDQMNSPSMKEATDLMKKYGYIGTGAIFNGNYEAPFRAVANAEGLQYRSDGRQWYLLLAFNWPARTLNSVAHTILYGLCNYKMLAYYDSIDHETLIEEVNGKLVFSNSFTDRFSFNPLGLKYLTSLLSVEVSRRCLVLSPKAICQFVSYMTDYLTASENIKPEELDFQKVMGGSILRAIDLGLLTCSNIILVSEDLLVLAFERDEAVYYRDLEKDFRILYSSHEIPEIQEPKSQRVLSAKVNGSSIFN